ncbi:MAG: hypothetical protein AAGL68_01195 [Pseudomonadota bacterium]
MQFWLASLACALLAACTTASAKSPARSDYTAQLTALEKLQALDQKLQNVGWRLVRGNAQFCEQTLPSIGLQLQDAVSYREPETVRATLGMDGDFAVQTVARESPAWNVGGLSFGREIARLNGEQLNAWPAEERSHWQRLTRAHDFIDAALAKDDRIFVGLASGGDLMIPPVEVCASRFELAGNSKRALAEGSRVVIGARFPGFDYPEDEFAAAIAHELAHNVLRHRIWLEANGRKRKHVRLTEREADRLMPWLLANAGYDPDAAYRFMTKWGPRHDGGLFRARTHDGWDERADFILAEIAQIESLQTQPDSEDSADWRTHFRREIDPDAPSNR